MSKGSEVIRLKPYQYVHVLDNNTNVTRLMVGPLTYTRLDHEVFAQKEPMNSIVVPQGHYCVIDHPIARGPDGSPLLEVNGQVKVRLGDSEIRLAQEPFPLYPQEVLAKNVSPLRVVSPLEAIRLQALRPFDDLSTGKSVPRRAGDEWMLNGPCVYMPSIEVREVETIVASIIPEGHGLHLRARFGCVSSDGTRRNAGEEWLVTTPGAYLPRVSEEVVGQVTPAVLTPARAIHVECRAAFKDRFGRDRKTGERWLVTHLQIPQFLPTPNEKLLGDAQLVTVSQRQYCVVNDVVGADGTPRLGHKELRKGQTTFFLHPGESLENGRIADIIVLADDEALVLVAQEKFVDANGETRHPGDRWMVRGPTEYIPPVSVTVQEHREAIPLDANEGVYVRNRNTGHVRAHIGSTIMLDAHEELYEKSIPPLVDELLALPRLTKMVKDPAQQRSNRVAHHVVTCRVPHNALVQLYDYKLKQARVVCGPDLVALGPDEEFTIVSLSGGKPKASDQIKSLCLNLGPDFMTDIIVVETSDHARLQLQLSYNWEFDRSIPKEQIFSVPDFVGDACKAIASRIRGAVAAESFDTFHRHSGRMIQQAVFGVDGPKQLVFFNNGLIVTGVDIHSVDPVDAKTREALTKSVQLAIEIATKSQEAIARHLATSLEQEARGRMERQGIADQALSEEHRKQLLLVEATNNAIETTGASKARSKAEADAKLITGQAHVDVTLLKSKSQRIVCQAELDMYIASRGAELDYREELCTLEIDRARALADIEAEAFEKRIEAIGRETIIAIARAGPELQVRLLAAMGVEGFMVTDGSTPFSFFQTANGLVPQGRPATVI